MAKIEKIETVTEYRLTLTPREAEILAAILARIGGEPSGDRQHANAIHVALKEAGIDWDNVMSTVSGSINF